MKPHATKRTAIAFILTCAIASPAMAQAPAKPNTASMVIAPGNIRRVRPAREQSRQHAGQTPDQPAGRQSDDSQQSSQRCDSQIVKERNNEVFNSNHPRFNFS